MTSLRIQALGEEALLLRLGEDIDAGTNTRVHALAAAIDARRPDWLLDIVPAYASLALFVDVDALASAAPLSARPPLERARQWLLRQSFDTLPARPAADAAGLEIPVLYGGEHGPDLADVAAHAGLDEPAAIALHAGPEYRVAMLGFAPGFPYLLGLDARLAMPRRDTPRLRVAAGSVAIGGAQTGLYPREGPGGWRIVGRTPLALFDPARPAPCLLAPGQPVRFRAIDRDAYARLAAAA